MADVYSWHGQNQEDFTLQKHASATAIGKIIGLCMMS